MSGADSRLNTLQIRKRLLLAESEVNRVQISQEWQCFENQTREWTRHAWSFCKTAGSIAAFGLTAFEAVRSLRAARTQRGNSWFSTLFEGVRLGTTLWNSIRSRSR